MAVCQLDYLLVHAGHKLITLFRKIASLFAIGMIAYCCHAQIVNPPSGGGTGTVTHTTGALTSGFVTIGNGGADIKVSPMDFGVSAVNTLTVPNVNITDPANVGLSFVQQSSNTSFTVAASVNVSSLQEYIYGVTGSSATQQGFLFQNAATGTNPLLLQNADTTHSVLSQPSFSVLGWSSGDPVATAIDTAISRCSVGLLCVGNGTQGNSSGGIKAVNLTLAASTAPTCTSAIAGQFQYTAGGTGVKDIVQVCAKDASDVFAWRTIY